MTWGIYARSDHPPGWGYAQRPGEGYGRAHGYVLLAVDCGDEPVPGHITDVPFGQLTVQLEGNANREQVAHGWDTWYGGDFDLVLTVEHRPHVEPDWGSQRYRSIGDNRAVLVVGLAELRGSGAKAHQW